MTDGIQTGYEHALYAVGWLLGVIPVLFLTSSTLLACWAAYRMLDHRLRAVRLRRDARRSGRTTVLARDYSANRQPDGSYHFPIV